MRMGILRNSTRTRIRTRIRISRKRTSMMRK